MKTLLSGRRFAPPARVCAVLAGLAVMAASVNAKTVNVDGTNFTTLSAAVAEAYIDTDPAVVNLQVDALPTPDGQVILDKPIVINGDADGNGTQCDIIANMAGIRASTDHTLVPPNRFNAFITVFAPGLVEINDVRIHPNADGTFNQAGTAREIDRISGIRLQNPTEVDTVGTYNLTNVYVSGSNSLGEFVPLDTAVDLFNQAGIMRWGGHNGFKSTQSEGKVDDPDGAYADDAAIQIEGLNGLGTFDSTLDHCQAGLSHSAALNLIANTGTHTVLGGVFGHCGRDGIRVGGTGVAIQGTELDRVRVVRNTNLPGDNSHSIEVANGGELLSLAYVDVAALNTANNFNFRSGTITLVEFCRGMGKFTDVGTPANQTVFIDNTNTVVGTIQNSTFHGLGGNPSPFTIDPGIVDTVDVIDCIFTSANNGTVNVNSAGTFTNCALPNDAVPGESLAASPVNGTFATLVTPPVSASPVYQATLANYDWSNAQNGDGNADVLRPSNSAAYVAAGTGGSNLVGGAGGTEAPVSLSGFTIE